MPLNTLNTSTDIQSNTSINLQPRNTDVEGSQEIAIFDREMEYNNISAPIVPHENILFEAIELRSQELLSGTNIITNHAEQNYHRSMGVFTSTLVRIVNKALNENDMTIIPTLWESTLKPLAREVNICLLCLSVCMPAKYNPVMNAMILLSTLMDSIDAETHSLTRVVGAFRLFGDMLME